MTHMISHSFLSRLGWDLSVPSFQYYSIPNPTINYIIQNARMKASQKLMQSCKSLKIKQLRNGHSEVNVFLIGNSGHKVLFGDYSLKSEKKPFSYDHSSQNSYNPIVEISVKKIKIKHQLSLYKIHIDNFNFILPKLDLSTTTLVSVGIQSELTLLHFKMLLSPSLFGFTFSSPNLVVNDKNLNLALLVFQKCPKLSRLHLDIDNIFFTTEMFKQMLSCKRETKFKRCVFDEIHDVDAFDVFKFIKAYMKNESELHLRTSNVDTFEILEAVLSDLAKTEQYSIQTTVVLFNSSQGIKHAKIEFLPILFGRWKLESSENGNNYLKAIGSSRLRRQCSQFFNPLIEIFFNRNSGHVIDRFYGKKFKFYFTFNEEAPKNDEEETTYVSEKILAKTFEDETVHVTFTLKAGKLFQVVEAWYKNECVERISEIERYVKDGKLVAEMKCRGVAAKFTYERE